MRLAPRLKRYLDAMTVNFDDGDTGMEVGEREQF